MAGFDPNAYLKEDEAQAFDPHSYVAEAPAGSDGPGAAQAALEHFGNAASMGYLPQLQAMSEKIMPNPSADTDAKLRAQGFQINEPDQSYVASRDANIARLKKEAEEHPIASAAGTVGGVLAGGAALGEVMGGAKAANAGARLIQGAKTGALMGAITNPGDTEGEIDPLQLGARYQNAKTGALTGGIMQGAIEAAPYVGKAAGYVARKVGSAISGVPQEEINNYVARTDQINKMIQDSGGELPAAADKVRQDTQTAIRSTRQNLSQKISQALDAAPKKPSIEAKPIIDSLEAAKAKLDPNFHREAIGAIDGMIEQVKQGMVPEGLSNSGQTNAKYLNLIKEYLQGRGSSAYMQNGQIFQTAPQAAQAAKGAAAVARKILNKAVPDVADANNQLSMLHSLEDSLNRNLIAPGKPDSALFAAGSGANARNAKMLGKLGELTGTNPLQSARDLATARTFANPALLPTDATGKSAARMLLAAGAGHMLAGPAGYAAAGLASPAAVKVAINAANVFKNTPSLVQFAQNNPVMFQRIAQSLTTPPKNQSAPEPVIDQRTLGIFKQNPDLIDSIADKKIKTAIMKQLNRAPARGPASWAQSGVQKLGIQDQNLIDKLMQDPKGKQLLIQASDLKPGSKAMKGIMTQIQTKFGGAK